MPLIVTVNTIAECHRTDSNIYWEKKKEALLFFHVVSLQFDTLFVAVHELPDSVGEVGFKLFSNSCTHSFFPFLITAKPATTKCLFNPFKTKRRLLYLKTSVLTAQ
jgi:hypothetical protein